jgi:hypothetical protein
VPGPSNSTGHYVSAIGTIEPQPGVVSAARIQLNIEDVTTTEPVKPTNIPAFDLDAALGDEQALKSDTLVDIAPPIAVRPPKKREFLRVHPTYSRLAEVVEYIPTDAMERSYYLISPGLKSRLEEEDRKVVRLVLCQSLADKTWFIWPMDVNADGKENAWNKSSDVFADEAKTRWARRVNRRTAYGIKYHPGNAGEPTWPEKSFKEILGEVFADRYIDSSEHPVFRALEEGL